MPFLLIPCVKSWHLFIAEPLLPLSQKKFLFSYCFFRIELNCTFSRLWSACNQGFTSWVVLLKFLYFRSGDSTARIWEIADGPSTSSMHNGLLNVVVLKHFKGQINEKSKDVTTLDWNVSFAWWILTSLICGFHIMEKNVIVYF